MYVMTTNVGKWYTVHLPAMLAMMIITQKQHHDCVIMNSSTLTKKSLLNRLPHTRLIVSMGPFSGDNKPA